MACVPAMAHRKKNERCEILYLTCRLPIYVGKAPQAPEPTITCHSLELFQDLAQRGLTEGDDV